MFFGSKKDEFVVKEALRALNVITCHFCEPISGQISDNICEKIQIWAFFVWISDPIAQKAVHTFGFVKSENHLVVSVFIMIGQLWILVQVYLHPDDVSRLDKSLLDPRLEFFICIGENLLKKLRIFAIVLEIDHCVVVLFKE